MAAPEVRIDTPGGHTPGALWVTAAPLPDSAGTLAILHLRPGERGDRRKRSDVRWLTGPDLRIWAFGPTHVEALNDSLDGQWLRQRPGQVLKYLLCNRSNVVLVDEIADSIWPGSGRQTVEQRALRHPPAAREARAAAPGARLARVRPRAERRLHAQSRARLDRRRRVRVAVDEGRAAMARMDSAAARRAFDYAIELYRRGDFLADDPYAEWAVDERHRLAGLASYALRVAIALAHERGDSVARRHATSTGSPSSSRSTAACTAS